MLSTIELNSALAFHLAEGSEWEERPEVTVVSKGTAGTLLIVEVEGDVNVSKLAPNLRQRAQQVAEDGFAHCVETHVVVIDGDEIETIECRDIKFSALENVVA